MPSKISQVDTSRHVRSSTVKCPQQANPQGQTIDLAAKAAGAMKSYCLAGVGFPLGEMKMWYKQTEEACAQPQIP